MSRYRADIDGLRAVAVLAVLGFHAFPQAVRGGFVGVDIFFVISGFLISRIILEDMEAGTFSIKKFYARRIRRIFPALICVLAACLAAGWIFLLPDEYSQLGKQVLAAAGFVSNIEFWREAGYFDVAGIRKPLLHLWSLGVEEQFYLFWPLCLAIFHRRRWSPLLWGAIFVVSLAVNLVVTPFHSGAAFYLPVTRLWELLLGFFALTLAHRVQASGAIRRELLAAVGLILVLGSIFTIDPAAGYPGWRALLPTLGTMLLILAGDSAWINRCILSKPAFVGVGLISYPLYLWHWPLLSFAAILMRPSGGSRLVLLAVAFLLSWSTWKLLENRLRRNRSPRVVPGLLAGMGTACLCAMGVRATQGADFRPEYRARSALIRDLTAGAAGIPCEHVHGAFGDCRQLRSGAVDAVVIGDSHAQALFAGLAQDPHRNWLLLSNSGCPPVRWIRVETDTTTHCTDKMQPMSDYLEDTSSPPIVVFAFYGYYAESSNFAADHVERQGGPSNYEIVAKGSKSKMDAFETGLSNLMQVPFARHKSVYVVVDGPELPFFPRDCIRRVATGQSGCVIPRNTIDARQLGLRKIVASLQRSWPALRIFDTLSLICGSGDCHPIRDGMSYYSDSHHLSVRGSQVVAHSLLQFIDATERGL